MIKVSPFIETIGTEKFKQFLALPFTINMLNSTSNETLFDSWQSINMTNYYKFTNNNKIIIEFYPKYYILYKDISNTTKYILSIPPTINDFINDMQRFNVQLYWTDSIDNNFEPKDYLNANKIKDYYIDLLEKMGKSNELL